MTDNYPLDAVGRKLMFGKGHACWGISSGSHSLDLIAGGTIRKLTEVDGRIKSREILSLTIIFDHDIVDGAPATRFTRRLIELIESGYGLDEDQSPATSRQLWSDQM